MADSKIDFSFENLHFSCEGENVWVERQLNNVLSRIPVLLAVHRKGENIVEEVIEVEEYVNEEKPKAPKTAKKEVKAPKEKEGTEKLSAKAKLSRKTKTAKTSKAKVSGVVEETVQDQVGVFVAADHAPLVSGVVEETVQDQVVKLGRKPKSAKTLAVKAEKAKNKAPKASPVAEQIDSPLSQYIQEKKVVSNQVRKFLTTAVFLARNNNLTKLSTPMIAKILKSYGIEKLKNASDCLNKNEKKGYCIKEGKEFIVTENGFLSIE